MKHLLQTWWNAPANYEWLLGFFHTRGVLRLLRILIGAGGLVMGVIVVLVQFSPGGPHGVIGRTTDAVVAAAAAGWVLVWWARPWPSPTRSLLLVAGADIGITLACLQDTDRLAALTGTMLFVVTGAYVTFFHSPKCLACHLLWVILAVVVLTVRMGLVHGLAGLALGCAKALIVLAVVVGILPALQFGYWLVHTSAVDSLVDPLTGLANRRGFDHHCPRFAAGSSKAPLCAIVVDLDAFKAVNDEHGHLVGDEVLARTAQRIRASVRSNALVARLGGEEFVVIDQLSVEVASVMSERIRVAIAAAPAPLVTASIGLAATDGRSIEGDDAIAVLTARADEAMYRAKRRGGNTVEVHVLAETEQTPGTCKAESSLEV